MSEWSEGLLGWPVMVSDQSRLVGEPVVYGCSGLFISLKDLKGLASLA